VVTIPGGERDRRPNAMPVILTSPGEFDLWLEGQTTEALMLQRPLPDARSLSWRREREDRARPSFWSDPALPVGVYRVVSNGIGKGGFLPYREGARDGSFGRRARLQRSPRERSECVPKPPFHCEHEIGFTAPSGVPIFSCELCTSTPTGHQQLAPRRGAKSRAWRGGGPFRPVGDPRRLVSSALASLCWSTARQGPGAKD
jgi:hypothetical protein